MGYAPLQYWFPNALEVPAAYQARFRDAAGRERCNLARHAQGPEEGKRGLLAAPAHDVVCNYRPQAQRWDRVAPGVWIGIEPALAIPERFARPAQFAGYRRKLGDGREWVIPVANPWAPSCALPSHDVLRDGEWVRQISDQYRALCAEAADLAERVRCAFLARPGGAPAVDVPDGQLRDLLSRVLGLNYDLTIEEMSALRLFGPEVYWPAVAAFLDWDAMQANILAAVEAARSGQPPFGGASEPAATSAGPSPETATTATTSPAPTSSGSNSMDQAAMVTEAEEA